MSFLTRTHFRRQYILFHFLFLLVLFQIVRFLLPNRCPLVFKRQTPTGKQLPQLSNQLLPSNDFFLSTSCRTRGNRGWGWEWGWRRRGRWTRQTRSRILSFLFFMKILVSIWFFFDGCRYIYILDSLVSFPFSFHFLSCSSFHQIKNNRGTKNGPDSGCDDHLFLVVFFSWKELVSDIISFRLYLFR